FSSSKENSVRPGARYGHLFVGLGEAYAPVDFRTGGPSWELGMFHGRILGINYIHDLSEHFYMAMGGGVYLGDNINWDTISLYSGLGAEFWRFYIFSFRTEIGMYSNLANYTGGKITVGLTVGF
ncbi:MAG: hypothetical protein KAG61_09975, partial [Bacteriovoracaceae bacterium]|nr:hypothetical protein [Bacteriovoracaceae bacterium]